MEEKKPSTFRVIGINVSRNLPKFAKSLEKALNELETAGYSIHSINQSKEGVVVIGLLVRNPAPGFFQELRNANARVAEADQKRMESEEKPLSDGTIRLLDVIQQVGRRVPPHLRAAKLKEVLEVTIRGCSPSEIAVYANEIEGLSKKHEAQHDGEKHDHDCLVMELFSEATKILRGFSAPNIH